MAASPRSFFVGLTLLLLATVALSMYEQSTWSPIRATMGSIRRIIGRSDQLVARETRHNAEPILDRQEAAGVANPSELRPAVIGGALKANENRQLYEEARATAEGRTVARPKQFTSVYTPWSDCIPFYGPLEVQASGYVRNLRRRTWSSIPPPRTVPLDDGYERVGPNGIPQGDVARGYDLPFPNDQHYLAFVGRIADERSRQPLTPAFLIGDKRILDPREFNGAKGCLQTAINQNQYLADALDGFNYSYAPVVR